MKIIFSFIIAAAIIIFAVQNTEQVEVSFLVWGLIMPRSVMLLFVFCLGSLFGVILSATIGHRQGKKRH